MQLIGTWLPLRFFQLLSTEKWVPRATMRDREEHVEQSALITWDNTGKMHGIWQSQIFCFWLKIYRKRMCSQDNPSLIMFETSRPLCSNNTLCDSWVQDFTAAFITIISVSVTQVQSHIPLFASSAFPWSNSRGTWINYSAVLLNYKRYLTNLKKLLTAFEHLLALKNSKPENDVKLPSSLNEDVTKVQFYRLVLVSINN